MANNLLSNLMYDDFDLNILFESDFRDAVREYETSERWLKGAGKLQSVSAIQQPSNNFMMAADPVLYADILDNSQMMMTFVQDNEGQTPIEELIPLGDTGKTSLQDRSRIFGGVLKDLTSLEWADVMNTCLGHAKGQVQAMIIGGKVRAVLSGDENDYSRLSMSRIFESASETLSKMFKSSSFELGNLNHRTASARYYVKSNELTKAYLPIIGRGNDVRVDARVIISTSDTGYSGANIHYELVLIDNKDMARIVPCMSNLKLAHKNKASIEQFEENLDKIFSVMMTYANNLMDLTEVKINYPQDCFLNLVEKAGLSKRVAMEFIPIGNTALDLYLALGDTLAKQNPTDVLAYLNGLEGVARFAAPYIKWSEYDYLR